MDRSTPSIGGPQPHSDQQHGPDSGTNGGHRRWISAVVLSVALLLIGASVSGGQSSATDARRQREEVRQQRAAAAAELDAARAEDAEVAEALEAITASVAAQEHALADAQRKLDAARIAAAEAEAEVAATEAEIETLRAELHAVAIRGYVDGEKEAQSLLLEAATPTEALAQSTMLQFANAGAVDLLEQLRAVQEDRDLASVVAANAVAEAEALEAEMAQILIELEQQRAVQAELKAEMEKRVASWEAQIADYASEEARLSEFIRQEEAKVVIVAPPAGSAPAAPGTTSSSGMQWPISGRVSSEYGWRIHPIFGTKRLHAGIDVGAPTGTPIYAAAGGTVISAGWNGGYGNAVVIAHGNGISTLYAHQSQIGVSNGATVNRGDVIGYVGSTGQSTGPHLHFEVRVNGSAVNPRGYLP